MTTSAGECIAHHPARPHRAFGDAPGMSDTLARLAQQVIDVQGL